MHLNGHKTVGTAEKEGRDVTWKCNAIRRTGHNTCQLLGEGLAIRYLKITVLYIRKELFLGL